MPSDPIPAAIAAPYEAEEEPVRPPSGASPIARLLNLEPGEGRLVSLLLGYSFFRGITITFFYVASSALFLSSYGSESLPVVYIISAFVSSFTGWVYRACDRRIDLPPLFTGTLLVLLASVIGFRLLLWLSPGTWPAFGMMVWYLTLYAFMSVSFWGVTGRLFNVRQGKRLFGLLGSGELVASIAGGLGTPLLVGALGTANLLTLSAAGILMCLVFLRRLISVTEGRLNRPPAPVRGPAVAQPGIADLLGQRYIVLIFAVYLLGGLVFYLIDFTFYDQTQGQVAGREELARFFGFFFAAVQTVTLLILTFLSGRLINRFGIRVGLVSRPATLGLLTIVLLAVGLLAGPKAAIFWVAVLAKLVDLMYYKALYSSSFRILYQPLQPERKLPTQVTVESTVGPIAAGIVGLVLLGYRMLGHLDLIPLNLLTLATVAAWCFCAILVYRHYRTTLADALGRRGLDRAGLSLDEGVLQEILRSRLGSPHAGEAIYALDLLEKADIEDMPATLEGQLAHPSDEVRIDALTRIGRMKDESLLEAVRTQVEVESVPKARAAALKALCELGEAEVVDFVAPFLDYPDREIQLGAMVGLLRGGGIDGTLLAGQFLIELGGSSDPADRVFSARVLEEVGVRNFYRPLLKLLGDEDPVVRRAALVAAGEVRSPRLWPLVLKCLASEQFHSHAATAIAAGGDLALPALEAAFSAPEASSRLKVRIAAIYGRIGGEGTIPRLTRLLDAEDRDVRSTVLESLSTCRFRAEAADVIDVRRLVRQEAEDAAWALGAVVDLEADRSAEPATRALQREIWKGRRRVLLLLSFLCDRTAILRASDNLLRPSSEQRRAYALEVLDTSLTQDLKVSLLPLFEDLTPAASVGRLRRDFPQPRLGRSGRLAEIVRTDSRWVHPWLRACAIHAARELTDEAALAAIHIRAEDENRLVRETALGALTDAGNSGAQGRGLQIGQAMAETLRQFVGKRRDGEEKEVPMLLTIEKVMVLRSLSIFENVPDDVLSNLAELAEETFTEKAGPIYEKGGMGRTMYVIVSGRVRMHDEDRTFVSLGEREFFGELTTLDPSPHSASASAEEDVTLLGLDRDALYEVMSEHPEILRGFIHILCERLRGKRR